MNIVLFSTDRETIDAGVQKSFEALCPGGGVDALHTIEGMEMRLMQPKDQSTAVVLFIRNRAELAELLALNPRLQSYQVILVLPDRDADTLNLAYQMAPRFISYIDRGDAEVKAVLKQMCKNDLHRFFSSSNELVNNYLGKTVKGHKRGRDAVPSPDGGMRQPLMAAADQGIGAMGSPARRTGLKGGVR